MFTVETPVKYTSIFQIYSRQIAVKWTVGHTRPKFKYARDEDINTEKSRDRQGPGRLAFGHQRQEEE